MDDAELHLASHQRYLTSVDQLPLNIVLFGRRFGADVLSKILSAGHRVSLVVTGTDEACVPLCSYAKQLRIPVTTDPKGALDVPHDVLISYLYPSRIAPSVIHQPRIGAFNFHAAPLPEARGIGGPMFAILENWKEYGVSVHWLSSGFDEGDIVKVDRYAVNLELETAATFLPHCYERLESLLDWFLLQLSDGRPLPRTPQSSGRYMSRRELENAKHVRPEDSPVMQDRRARAFWNPSFR